MKGFTCSGVQLYVAADDETTVNLHVFLREGVGGVVALLDNLEELAIHGNLCFAEVLHFVEVLLARDDPGIFLRPLAVEGRVKETGDHGGGITLGIGVLMGVGIEYGGSHIVHLHILH